MKTINLKKIFTTLFLVIVVTFAANAHKLGADYIYRCPKCSNFLKKGSNISGNTFGSILYSDGKMIAPMLPEFPNLTKCTKCDTILCLSDMKEVGTCNSWGGKCKKEWKGADRVAFLDVPDLFRFLELDTVKYNKKRELYVRQKIWWAYNDRAREGKETFTQESDEILWKQNAYFGDTHPLISVISTQSSLH